MLYKSNLDPPEPAFQSANIPNLSAYSNLNNNIKSVADSIPNSYSYNSSSHPPGLSSRSQQLTTPTSNYAPKGVVGGATGGPSISSSARPTELSKIVIAQLAVLITTIKEDNWDSAVAQIREVTFHIITHLCVLTE